MSNKQEMLYGLCMIVLALQVTAISTDHWSVKTINTGVKDVNIDGTFGLWKGCGELWGKSQGISGDIDVCLHLPVEGMKSFPKNALYAARAFSIMGAIFIFAALVCMMYMKGYKRCQMVCLFVGGVSSLIAMAIWSAELLKVKVSDGASPIKFNPGYSFYLNLAGGIMGLMAAAYHYYGK